MKPTTWKDQHKAIVSLMNYLDEELPKITLTSTAGSIFMGATALYRCNRLLRAVDSAVEHGLGDTAGGNVRTLYDTWVFGHLLMISEFDDARKTWGMTRSQAEKVARAMGLEEKIIYPGGTPDAEKDTPAEQRAIALGKKLTAEDPDNATLPEYCYNNVYRPESHLSSHANIDAINQYAIPVGELDGEIGLSGKNEHVRWRTRLAAYLTLYFATQVFKKAKLDDSKLKELESVLDLPKDQTPPVQRDPSSP